MNNAKLTNVGKLFFASALAWVFGKKMNFKVRGTPEQVQALSNALIASKKFQEEIKNPDATINSILEKLKLKKQMADEFFEKTGTVWPL